MDYLVLLVMLDSVERGQLESKFDVAGLEVLRWLFSAAVVAVGLLRG